MDSDRWGECQNVEKGEEEEVGTSGKLMNKCRQNKFCGVWTRAKFGQSSDYEVKFIEKDRKSVV